LNFLETVDFPSIVNNVKNLSAMVENLTGVSVLDTPIPLLNQSLGDILEGPPTILDMDQTATFLGVSPVVVVGDRKQFTATFDGGNLLGRGVAVGNPVTYLDGNNQVRTGSIDEVTASSFTVGFNASLDQDPMPVGSPGFQIQRTGATLVDQIKNILGGVS